MTCWLGTDAKLRQSVPHVDVVGVNVGADLRQGRNVPSACVCWPPWPCSAEWKSGETWSWGLIEWGRTHQGSTDNNETMWTFCRNEPFLSSDLMLLFQVSSGGRSAVSRQALSKSAQGTKSEHSKNLKKLSFGLWVGVLSSRNGLLGGQQLRPGVLGVCCLSEGVSWDSVRWEKGKKRVADDSLPSSITTAWWDQHPRRNAFASLRGSKGKRSSLNTNLDCACCFFSPSPSDKEACSLLVKATSALSREQRCKVQSCKGASPLSGGGPIFSIYQLSQETAGLAVCWQRQSHPFLCCTPLQMFTGTKHKPLVHDLFVELKNLQVFEKVDSDCGGQDGGRVEVLSVYHRPCCMFTELLLALALLNSL